MGGTFVRCMRAAAVGMMLVISTVTANAAGALAVGSCAAYGYAYAIDGRNKCGAHGYASAPTLGRAQNVALRFCYKYGGRDCMVRAWACDGSG